MGLLKKAKADMVSDNAKRAMEEGHTVFLCQIGSTFGGAISGVAETIEAVEELGWRLEQMSHVWSTDMSNHLSGIYLFRRAA